MDASSQHPAASASREAIPHRTHSHRAANAPSAVGMQPDPLVRFVRMGLSIAVGALAMFLVLVGAVKYLQRDWADKNRRARSMGSQSSTATPSSASATVRTDGGRPWAVPAPAQEQFLASLSCGPTPRIWLLQGFGCGLSPGARRRAALLDLAENGDGVQFRNLHAALLLKHGDVLQAVAQLRRAERIAPGYPPTLYNRALCALMSDLPEQALLWLVRYRARYPSDAQAARLHFNLLVQLDRPAEAMDTLDRFLATQPPSQPLILDAAVQAAQMDRVSDAIRYLEIAQRGHPPAVIARIYQSPAFRNIRLSPEGTAFAERLARRARASLARSSAVQPKTPSELSSPNRIPVAPKFH